MTSLGLVSGLSRTRLWLVPDLSLPILYISGTEDKNCPHEHTLKLHKLSKNTPWPADLFVVKGAAHFDVWHKEAEKYLEKLGEFIDQCVSKY